MAEGEKSGEHTSPEHIVTNKLQEAADCLSDDGGAQVTNVHLLGNIGGGEVDNNTQPSRDRRWTNAVQKDVRYEIRDKGRAEGDVDETWPGYITLFVTDKHTMKEREFSTLLIRILEILPVNCVQFP